MQKGPEKDRRWVTACNYLLPVWSGRESSAPRQYLDQPTDSPKRWHPSTREMLPLRSGSRGVADGSA